MAKPILEKDGNKSESGINIPWYVAVHSHPLLNPAHRAR